MSNVNNILQLYADNQQAGVVLWKPNGFHIYHALQSYIRDIMVNSSYQQVKSPSVIRYDLLEQSGHADKYHDYLFNIDELHVLRPMSCPNHIQLYQSEKRSYRDLPVKYFEFGEVFRNEASGALLHLKRQRQFCQDDGHVFARRDQQLDIIKDYIAIAQNVYAKLGFHNIRYGIALRPEQRYGDDQLWDEAENVLRQACIDHNLPFIEEHGGGAFYGPKLELQVQDAQGRWWQMGVIQLDYVLPERFGLEYVNAENHLERPVLLHHAVLGSLERMIGVLLDVYDAKLPAWLHPIPQVIIPVSDRHLEYARMYQKDKGGVIRDNGTLNNRVRQARMEGVPSIVVIGDKEIARYQESGEW